MSEVLFDKVSQVLLGQICPGRLRLRQNDFMFKNVQTNKTDHFLRDQIVDATWVPRALGNALRLKNDKGEIFKYDGFSDNDVEKITAFFKKNFDVEIGKIDVFVKGFNWGDIDFDENVLQMKNKDSIMFELPMEHLYNASCQKDEIIMEINQNDDADICLSELRFHVPTTEEDEESKADQLFSIIKKKAGILDNVGDSIVQFSELHCLQPRGRYDFKFYKTFIHMHGKSYDYKIPKASCMRLIVLPHPSERKVFVTLNLQPPLKHGLTNYHFLIILCDKDSVFEAELNAEKDFLKENFGNDDENISGPEHDVLSKLLHSLYKIKVSSPGSYQTSEGLNSISCTFKTSSGLLYPLERAFIFVPKPTPFIRFEEITSVQFVRGTYIAKSFDFTIQTKAGIEYNFSSIDKKDYDSIFNFVTAKNIRVVKSDDKAVVPETSMNEDWSSSDDSRDVYLQKVKKEGKVHGAGGEDSDESDDQDFAPPGESNSEVSDEYDSNVSSTSSEDEKKSEAGSGDEEHKVSPKKAKKESRPKPASDKEPRKKASKKDRDPNMPNRPATAYIMWFNANRLRITEMLPAGSGIPEVGKKAGELWKALEADEKNEFLEKAQKLKAEYDEKMKLYIEEHGPIEKTTKTKKSKAGGSPKKSLSKPKKESSAPSTSTTKHKSQEYVEDDDSSSISDLD